MPSTALESDPAVHHNESARRYEMEVEGALAVATYAERGNGVLVFDHTVVPSHLEGRGIASRLIKAALADVRARGLKIVPQCSFVAVYIQRHPGEADLLA